MKELTPKEAIKILHPDTSRDALWKIEYYAGFNAEKARLKAVEDACVVACEALEKQIPKKILYRKQNYGTPWLCCECETDQTPTEFMSEDGSEPKEKHTYCWKCGQKLDWGDYK